MHPPQHTSQGAVPSRLTKTPAKERADTVASLYIEKKAALLFIVISAAAK
jgi:hypothetical protein